MKEYLSAACLSASEEAFVNPNVELGGVRGNREAYKRLSPWYKGPVLTVDKEKGKEQPAKK